MKGITINISVPVETEALISASNSLLLLAEICGNPAPPPTLEDPVATTTLNAPAPVEVDSAGLPWDERIHSSKRTKLAKDKTWKNARGVDKNLVIQVEAELRAAMNASAPAPAPPPASTSAPAPAPPPASTSAPAPAPPPASTSAPAPAPVLYYNIGGENYTANELREGGWNEDQINALPVVEVAQNDIDFPTIMSKITEAVAAGTLTNEQVNAACNAKGLASLPLLASRPDLVSAIDQALFQ